jgi:DHA1 family solute carrier family 18 vesicular amine transporter 1/2
MGKAAEYMSRTKIGARFHETRESRKLVLVIVAIALLLDNMLLTTVVPIIPEFLYTIRHQKDLKNATLDIASEPPAGPELTTDSPISITTMDSMSDQYSADYTDPGGGVVEATTMENDDMYILEDGEKKRKKRDTGYIIRTKRSRGSNLFQHHRLTAEERKHKELIQENIEVGVMFASKAVVQLITNPFVGPLTNRIGYEVPMFCGFIIMFLSTIIFAFSRSYFILFLARALQGIGSSFSSVSGMGMLADRYPDDQERGNAMGIALGGLALGVLIGPPFGGFMYQFIGKSAPFIVLAFLALFDGALQLLVLQPKIERRNEDAPSLKSLISDPYILIASGAITFANMGIAMLEPSLPIFMMDRMNAEKWQLGAAFLPASISYLIGTNLFGPLGHRVGRWLASLVGLYVIGFALILVPFASAPNHLIIPMAALGFGIGMVDSSMMPELGNLVDLRHGSVYGGVYAIGDIAFCLGFAVGPALSGSLVQGIGFEKMLIGIAIICFLYGPMLCALKDVPPKTEQEKQENSQLMEGGCNKTAVKYANFDDQLLQQPPYLDSDANNGKLP